MVAHQVAHTVAVLAFCRRLQVSLPFSSCAPTISVAFVGPLDSLQIPWLVFRPCVARVTSCNAGVRETLLRTVVSALLVYRAVLRPPIMCWALHSCKAPIASEILYQITNVGNARHLPGHINVPCHVPFAWHRNVCGSSS